MQARKRGSASTTFRSGLLTGAAITLATLSACGGGGGGGNDGGASPSGVAGNLDAYVTTWVSDCYAVNGTSSGRQQIVVTKTSPSVLSLAYSVQVYASNTTCQGAMTRLVSTGTEIATFQGTKVTSDNMLVDKASVNTGSSTYKQIYSTDGVTTYQGQDDSPPDGNGYPTELDRTLAFHKM